MMMIYFITCTIVLLFHYYFLEIFSLYLYVIYLQYDNITSQYTVHLTSRWWCEVHNVWEHGDRIIYYDITVHTSIHVILIPMRVRIVGGGRGDWHMIGGDRGGCWLVGDDRVGSCTVDGGRVGWWVVGSGRGWYWMIGGGRVGSWTVGDGRVGCWMVGGGRVGCWVVGSGRGWYWMVRGGRDDC